MCGVQGYTMYRVQGPGVRYAQGSALLQAFHLGKDGDRSADYHMTPHPILPHHLRLSYPRRECRADRNL